MAAVISTLPLRVLVNDQLTSTRSEVEAFAVFTPGYVRTDVNFATDSASDARVLRSSCDGRRQRMIRSTHSSTAAKPALAHARCSARAPSGGVNRGRKVR